MTSNEAGRELNEKAETVDQGRDGLASGEPVRLIGWKRIGAHLGCSDRTARRWEQEESLPVHRQRHESKSTVFAYQHELDAWLTSRSPKEETSSRGALPEIFHRGARKGSLVVFGVLVAALISFVTISELPPKTPDETVMSSDPIAVDLFERGRALWLQRGEVPNARAIKLLEQAVAKDPEFAEAWAALASAWATFPTYNGDMSPQASLDKAILAADRALSLDPSLGEPRVVKATIAQRSGDWFRSEEIFEDALLAAPDNPTVYLWYTAHYRELGMFDEAKLQIDKALSLDPTSPPALVEQAMNTLQSDIDEGSRKLRYLWFDLGFESPVIWTGIWMSHILRDDLGGAKTWIDENRFFPKQSDLMKRFVRELEDPSQETANALITDIDQARDDGFPPWIGFYMIANLNRPDAALDYAQVEADDAGFETSVVLFDRYMSAHRRTERFADLVEQLGFTDYWRERGLPTICKAEANAPYCLRASQAVQVNTR